MNVVLSPDLEQQYRDALKAVRRELRQTGHTIDGRVHPRHQPRALVESIGSHLPADDPDTHDDECQLQHAFQVPGPEQIELPTNYPLSGEHDDFQPDCFFRVEYVPRRFHLEPPLLATNPNQDLRDVLWDMSAEARTNPLYTTTLVTEPLDEDNAESQGLDPRISARIDDDLAQECNRWFASAWQEIADHSDELSNALQRLRLIKDSATNVQFSDMGRKGHLSPPLMPSPEKSENQQQLQPFPINNPRLSSPDNLLGHDITAVEKEIKFRDRIESSEADALDESPPFPRLNPLFGDLSREIARPSKFQLETPLVLRDEFQEDSQQPRPSVCLFTDDPFIDAYFPTITSSTQSSEIDAGLQRSLRTASSKIEEALKHDRLDSVDPLICLKIPAVAPLDLRPDWEHCRGTDDMRRHLRRTLGSTYKVVTPSEKHMPLKLKWNPVPAKYTTWTSGEHIEPINPDVLESWKRKMPVTSQDLVRKHKIPAILVDQGHEDPLPSVEGEPTPTFSAYFPAPSKKFSPAHSHPPVPQPGSDLTALIRKRKAESQLLKMPDRHRTSHMKLNPATPPRRSLLVDCEDLNPTARLLNNLMQIRAPEKAEVLSKLTLPTPARSSGNRFQGAQAQDTAAAPPTSYHYPTIKMPSGPPRLLISTAVSRTFVTLLKDWLPGVVLVDRDLSANQAAEADLIASPTTGIILTTMLKVRQVALPGSAAISQLRERVVQVALLYEQLVVIVSEDNPTSEAVNRMSDSDARAYRSFVVFALAIRGTRVRVFYAGGGTKTLASWAAFAACEFAPGNDLQKFLNGGETPLELFFRRVGLNAYAAQVLVGHFDNTYGKEGLRSFLIMTVEEKLQAFRHVVGSDILIRRIALALS